MSIDLLSRDLYETALLNPVFSETGADRLLIVSGYASSAMAFHHLNELREKERLVSVDLIYGMVKSDGITRSNHRGFQSLVRDTFKGHFTCSYLVKGEPVHAKIYIWCKNGVPVFAYAGSANYSQIAFLNSTRREVLTPCDPVKAYHFYSALRGDSLSCLASDIDRKIDVGNSAFPQHSPSSNTEGLSENTVSDKNSPYYGLSKATISFLDKKSGEVPARSGLNWGQREEYRREPNQAYLSVRGDLKKSDFFPPLGIYFTVLTDDGQVLQCVRAQQTAKAIETPHDNSELGRYIRNRAGIPLGMKVTRAALERYGRTAVDFYKIDSENFYMDFSVQTSRR